MAPAKSLLVRVRESRIYIETGGDEQGIVWNNGNGTSGRAEVVSSRGGEFDSSIEMEHGRQKEEDLLLCGHAEGRKTFR